MWGENPHSEEQSKKIILIRNQVNVRHQNEGVLDVEERVIYDPCVMRVEKPWIGIRNFLKIREVVQEVRVENVKSLLIHKRKLTLSHKICGIKILFIKLFWYVFYKVNLIWVLSLCETVSCTDHVKSG